MGCFGGYREQEFAMASRHKIRWYVAPDGTKIARAFLLEDFLSYDRYQIAIPLRQAVRNRDNILSMGNRYKIQKKSAQRADHTLFPSGSPLPSILCSGNWP